MEVEKIKNQAQVRSTSLRIFLLFATFVAGYGLFSFLGAVLGTYQGDERIKLIMQVSWFEQLIALLCLLFGMWRWKKWGFYGYLAIIAFNIIFQLLIGNIPQVFFNAGLIALIVYIVRPQLALFD